MQENFFKCPICFLKYNDSINKPYCLQCGHSMCFKCIEKLNKCPFDTEKIVNKFPNYALIPSLEDLKKSSKLTSISTEECMKLPEIVEIIHTSKDIIKLYRAVQSIRIMLSCKLTQPINDIIKANLVPSLVNYLNCNEHPDLQLEAALVLTNICAGTSAQKKHVVESDAVASFVKLLLSSHLEIREQVVSALANIVGDCVELRDLAVKSGIFEQIIALIKISDTTTTLLRQITRTLSNLFKYNKSLPSIHLIKELLPSLSELLNCNDKKVLTNTFWTLCYMTNSDHDNNKIDAVIKSGLVPRLVELLKLNCKNEEEILIPAVRCIGNITTGSADHTQTVIDSQALPVFHQLLTHSKLTVQKETAWTVSNITAGTQSQIQAVLQAKLIPLVVNLLASTDLSVQKEAAWTIKNFACGASAEQLIYLDQCQVIKPICDLLSATDTDLVEILLDVRTVLLIEEKKRISLKRS